MFFYTVFAQLCQRNGYVLHQIHIVLTPIVKVNQRIFSWVVFSITHWLILLVVVVVILAPQNWKNAGKDLGGAVKGFKDAVKDENEQHLNKTVSLEHEKAELNTTQTQQDKHNV